LRAAKPLCHSAPFQGKVFFVHNIPRGTLPKIIFSFATALYVSGCASSVQLSRPANDSGVVPEAVVAQVQADSQPRSRKVKIQPALVLKALPVDYVRSPKVEAASVEKYTPEPVEFYRRKLEEAFPFSDRMKERSYEDWYQARFYGDPPILPVRARFLVSELSQMPEAEKRKAGEAASLFARDCILKREMRVLVYLGWNMDRVGFNEKFAEGAQKGRPRYNWRGTHSILKKTFPTLSPANKALLIKEIKDEMEIARPRTVVEAGKEKELGHPEMYAAMGALNNLLEALNSTSAPAARVSTKAGKSQPLPHNR
jgi:hypothetical protein